MRLRSLLTLVLAALAAVSVSVTGPGTALAGKKTYEDKKLGFRMKIEDSYVQNPPKLTADEAFIVGDWYEDAAKFDQGNLRPTFQVMWFVEPKSTGPEKAPDPASSGGMPSRDDLERQFRDAMRATSFDEQMDRMFEYNVRLFGEAIPMKDRWAQAKKDKTAGKNPIPFDWVEINAPSKKKRKSGEPEPEGYVYLAKLDLDRPDETIHVGFWGSCGVAYVKRFEKEFPAMVRSFEELKNATDSRNESAGVDLSQDRSKLFEQIRKQKLVKGWNAEETKNYILVYHDEVDSKLVKQIGVQIEAIRAQVYEVLFPPDKPVTAVSVVRVCKDRDQYMGYGAPPSSAGYWDSNAGELVFYESAPKKDSLRVLYHEAFHQYIYYSVGDVAPHSWFNEGHGDYFAGHNYAGGRFSREVFQERISDAKEWKRNPQRPPLREWITWTQMQYYGRNKAGISALHNYGAGWSLVYYLRTTKKPEYQGVLERYFNSLKGAVTRARDADAEWEKKMKEWEEKVKTDPSIPMPEQGETSDRGSMDQWLKGAVAEAFKGIDWDAIEKDWLAADY